MHLSSAQEFTFQPVAKLLQRGNYRIKKVVLDAGHGGKDPGCLGASAYEKHNTLEVVLKLGAYINHYFPEIEVIYTRDSDVFIELHERAAIANRNNADLFISVHCNAISNKNRAGTETYVLGLHKAKENLEVAKRENASIFMEDNYEKKYEGYDPNSPEAHILGGIWQSAYLEQSILFAGFVQQYAASHAARSDLGVKQAGFLVLRETAMPAVLIETGYLTNATEEAFLASETGRQDMANAIFHAFKAYKSHMEGGGVSEVAQSKPKSKPSPEKGSDSGSVAASKAKTEKTEPKAKPKQVSQTAPAKSPQCRIWLMSWSKKMDINSGKLSLLSGIKEELVDGEYHYYTAAYPDCREAEIMLPEIKNLGFKSAKIVEK